MSSIIKVTNLTKKYKLYKEPIDRLKEALHPLKKKYHQEFLANSSISFEIKKGQVVGIIGRNGSGKSTLLKMITGVLSPTSGSVEVNGKITAMLELGAGFNPELSGMENLYMSGAISGFSRVEMEAKINDIIAFADIGEFIYQPLKTYSSGMKARLGFAFSINVEPEILIIDEALSVGDVAFQRKCYAKIENMCKDEAVTVLFVSHSGGVIKQLCSRAIMLRNGQKILDGKPKDVINIYEKFSTSYQNSNRLKIQEEFEKLVDKKETVQVNNHQLLYNPTYQSKSMIIYEKNGAEIYDVFIEDEDGEKCNVLHFGDYYYYSYRIKFFERYQKVYVAAMLKNTQGVAITGVGVPLSDQCIESVECGEEYYVKWKFKNILNEGFYFFSCGVRDKSYGEINILHRILDAYMFKSIKDNKNNYANSLVDLGMDLFISKIK